MIFIFLLPFLCPTAPALGAPTHGRLSPAQEMIIDSFFFPVILYLVVTLCRNAVSSSLSRRKRRRVVHGVHKDLISLLPDDILILIIARIPSRTAVSTSILSKRWRNLIYKSVSRFEFCCTDLLPHHSIPPHDSYCRLVISRVERFLRLCTGSNIRHHSIPPHDSYCRLVLSRVERFLRLCSGSKIHYFMLECCLTESNYNLFEQCIYSLGKSGIEELSLHLSCAMKPIYVPFPCHLLPELPSLKRLTLSTCSLPPNLKSKCYSLQTLDLWLVTILPGSLECILSNCLSLHTVFIFHCRCPPKLCFRSPSPQLKTLRIENRTCEGAAEIELHASNLTTFECRSIGVVNFVFDYVPRLETVYIALDTWIHDSLTQSNLMPYVFGEVPKVVPGIKFLTFETIGDFQQDSTLGMETFRNLRKLDICVSCTPRTNLLAFTPYLERCPLLEELRLTARNMYPDLVVQRKHVVAVHTKLKKAEMTGFCGTDNEIEFALYILRSAVVLDQMLIVRCPKYYEGSGRWETDSRPAFREEDWKKIEQSLQEQAISKTAKLIIQHQ